MKSAFPPIVTPQSEILFLGTMPGEKSLELGQYYGNRGNQFWKLLFEVMAHPFLDDYNDRLRFIKENNFALWDVLQLCEREGSLDSNIKNEVANDFETFFKSHPSLRAVFFTSKKAEWFYNRYAVKKEGIAYYVLPSPSGAYAFMPYAQKLDLWRKKILPLINP